MGKMSKARQRAQSPVGLEQDAGVAAEGGRVARHVGDGPQRAPVGLVEGAHDVDARALAGGVEHDDVGPAQFGRDELGCHGGGQHLELGQGGPVVAGVGAGPGVPLDRQDGAGRSDGLGQRHREEPGTGVEVGHGLAGRRTGQVEDGTEQRVGRADVRLPEYAGRNAVRVAAHNGADGARLTAHLTAHDEPGAQRGQPRLGAAVRGGVHVHECLAGRGIGDDLELARSGPRGTQGAGGRHLWRGDGARVDDFDLMGAMPAEAHGAAAVHRDADAAAPGQPVRGPLDGLHLYGTLDTRHPAQLLGYPERLEAPLGAQLHVLVIAAATAPGPGVGTGRRHPVGRGVEDLDGVGPQVRRGGGGHPGPHPLAGQGMADEHDPAVGGPGHTAAAGRGRARFQFEHLVGRRNRRGDHPGSVRRRAVRPGPPWPLVAPERQRRGVLRSSHGGSPADFAPNSEVRTTAWTAKSEVESHGQRERYPPTAANRQNCVDPGPGRSS